MNTNLILAGFCALPILLCFACTAVVAGQYEQEPDTPNAEVSALAECYSAGQQIAIRESGTLYKAEAVSDGDENQEVCRVVVVIPGAEGERPRRAECWFPLRSDPGERKISTEN